MKKLLIFAKTIDGGTGTYLTNLLQIKRIIENKFLISVAVLERPIYMQRQSEEFYYMKTRDYSFAKYSISFKNIDDFIKEFFWIKNIITKETPDIILGVDVNCNIYIGIIKTFFRKNIKTIFTTHSDLVGNLDQRATRFLKTILKVVIKFFYSKSDSIICVSTLLSDSLRSYFSINKEIITIYNGLDNNKCIQRNFLNKNNRIISVARLDKQKDHLTLLKAFKLINKEIKDTSLWLIGDGPLKNDLIHFAKKNCLEKNVKFLGWQENLDEYFSEADIFVLSSRREGFPYALIEALSVGIPVVCTDTPYGPSEILEEGKYGFLVPMYGYVQIKEAILELLKKPDVYTKFSKLALERSNAFTTDRMIRLYADEINKFL